MSTNDKNSKQQEEKEMEVEISERYINPYTDFGFKKLFGSELNKDLLISFLNALFHDKPEITDLTYMNTEHLGEGIVDRRAVFDVYCRLADGSRIIVSVGILNFTFPEGEYPSDSIIHEIKLKDVEDNHVFYDKLTFVYLEMPKFNKTEDELETMFDKWMFALSNLARLLERPKALQERIFARLFEQAEVARFTPQERNEYVASKKEYWDAYSIASTSYNKGLAKGLAEGETKGIAKGIAKGEAKGRAEAKAEARQEKLESARKLKARGFSADDIVEIIGITPEELDTL